MASATGMPLNTASCARTAAINGCWRAALWCSATADGRALRLVGTLVDVSKRKQIEADLLAAAQFQQAVFDSISAQIAVLDQAGNIVQTNAAWQSYADEFEFGASLGQNYLALLAGHFVVAEAARDALVAGMAAVAAGDAPHFHLPEPVQCNCGKLLVHHQVHAGARRGAPHGGHARRCQRSQTGRTGQCGAGQRGQSDRRLEPATFPDIWRSRNWRASQRYELPLVVLMLDLDHFKQVNDTYGHQAGDAVLHGFVKTVKSVLRESDVMGRIGGEEFAVLLPNTTQQGGAALANRILESVRSGPVDVCGQRIPYTVSIGAGCLTTQKSFAELLGQCDAALYRGQTRGA